MTDLLLRIAFRHAENDKDNHGTSQPKPDTNQVPGTSTTSRASFAHLNSPTIRVLASSPRSRFCSWKAEAMTPKDLEEIERRAKPAECGAVEGPVSCHLESGHDGPHFGALVSNGTVLRWVEWPAESRPTSGGRPSLSDQSTREAFLRLHLEVCKLGLELSQRLPMPRWVKDAARDRLTEAIAADVAAIEEGQARWKR